MLGDMPFNFLFYLVFARRTEMNMGSLFGLDFELWIRKAHFSRRFKRILSCKIYCCIWFYFAHSAVYIARYTSLHGLNFFEDNMRSS